MSIPSSIVAGHSNGIKVSVSPALKPVYDKLKQLALQGHHWARVTTKEINSLTSGHMKSNVFVSSSPGGNSIVEFTLLLPGCKAKAIKKSSGQYHIYHMELDVGYGELVRSGAKPALYQVSKDSSVGRWSAKLKPEGSIVPNSKRIVVVSDGHQDVNDASALCATHASALCATHASGAPIGGGSYSVDMDGFDMQYHYSNSKIGGLTQIAVAQNPQSDMKLRENALKLADTMQQAAGVPGVAWISERGGSGVLTQAMYILKTRNINFKDSKHHVFFSEPTTNLNTAESAARDLGLAFARKSHSANKLNPNVLVGGLNFGGDFVGAYQRYKGDESYTALNMGTDMAGGVTSNWKVISTMGASSAAVTAALGLGGTAMMLPASIAIAGTVAGVGGELFKAWMPNRYRLIKSKL